MAALAAHHGKSAKISKLASAFAPCASSRAKGAVAHRLAAALASKASRFCTAPSNHASASNAVEGQVRSSQSERVGALQRLQSALEAGLRAPRAAERTLNQQKQAQQQKQRKAEARAIALAEAEEKNGEKSKKRRSDGRSLMGRKSKTSTADTRRLEMLLGKDNATSVQGSGEHFKSEMQRQPTRPSSGTGKKMRRGRR